MSRYNLATVVPLAVALGASAPLHAQTVDRARLVVGLSMGRIGGNHLWDVARQAIPSSSRSVPDTFELHREVPAGLSFNGHVTYFASPSVGFTAELNYLGLGTQTTCVLQYDDGDASLVRACQGLLDNSVSASVVSVQVGVVGRPVLNAVVQPYFKMLAGLAVTPSSTTQTVSTYLARDGRVASLAVFNDSEWESQRPTWTVAAGIATTRSHGMQLRLEFRETWLAQSVVTGSNPTSNQDAPSKSVIKAFPAVYLGFEIVFAREQTRSH